MCLNDSVVTCVLIIVVIVPFMCLSFVIFLSRLPKEDHRAGKIIQDHQGWRYYDRRGTNHRIFIV